MRKQTSDLPSRPPIGVKISAGYNVTIIGNKCFRCNHAWIPRKRDDKSAVCPKCKSPYWDKPKKTKKRH